jgi:DNA polymerase I
LIQHGVRLLAPLHDAVLIEAPVEELAEKTELTRQLLGRASADILDGFEIRTDAEVVVYPDRYMDDRGAPMWAEVMQILGELGA